MHIAVLAAVVSTLATGVAAQRAAGAAIEPVPVFEQTTGVEDIHVVKQGETIGHIAAHFGMKRDLAAVVNQLADPNRLHIGQQLRLSNRHIVPGTLRDGLVINAGELTLYWLRDGQLVGRFPVGVGRVAWQTPPGHYTIVGRRRDPIWHVPPSIQREMRERGEEVKKKVLPGPDNPLGKYWLQLSVPAYGIHGTNAPHSVGKYTTHGCIRMRADDIERLFNEVPNGTAVDVIDEPIKVARLEDGTILLEAHPGVSGPSPDSTAGLAERLRAAGLSDLVNLTVAEQVVRETWGVAVDVSQRGNAGALAKTDGAP